MTASFLPVALVLLFLFNATAPTKLYTLSLHDALPISRTKASLYFRNFSIFFLEMALRITSQSRSEEHTSELQSRFDLVCRLLLEKKKDLDTGTFTDYLGDRTEIRVRSNLHVRHAEQSP